MQVCILVNDYYPSDVLTSCMCGITNDDISSHSLHHRHHTCAMQEIRAAKTSQAKACIKGSLDTLQVIEYAATVLLQVRVPFSCSLTYAARQVCIYALLFAFAIVGSCGIKLHQSRQAMRENHAEE
jgi:hypothetical protein